MDIHAFCFSNSPIPRIPRVCRSPCPCSCLVALVLSLIQIAIFSLKVSGGVDRRRRAFQLQLNLLCICDATMHHTYGTQERCACTLQSSQNRKLTKTMHFLTCNYADAVPPPQVRRYTCGQPLHSHNCLYIEDLQGKKNNFTCIDHTEVHGQQSCAADAT